MITIFHPSIKTFNLLFLQLVTQNADKSLAFLDKEHKMLAILASIDLFQLILFHARTSIKQSPIRLRYYNYWVL